MRKEGKFDEEIAQLQTALSLIPNDTELKTALQLSEQTKTNQRHTDVINLAKNYANEGLYLSAIEKLEYELTEYGQDTEIEQLINAYKEEYKKHSINKADEKALNKEYAEAISILERVGDDISEEIDYSLRIEKYREEWLKYAERSQPVEVLLSDYEWTTQFLKHTGKLFITIKNNTEANIKSLVVTVLHYNADNEPCEGEVQSIGSKESYKHIAQEEVNGLNIKPQETYIITVELHSVQKVTIRRYSIEPSLCQGIACVKTIILADNTRIENQYHQFWLANNEGKTLSKH